MVTALIKVEVEVKRCTAVGTNESGNDESIKSRGRFQSMPYPIISLQSSQMYTGTKYQSRPGMPYFTCARL